MRRALLLAVLLAGCNAGPKPLAKGDPVLVDSGGKDVLVWTENPKHKDRADSIIIAGGSRAIFLDAEPAEGPGSPHWSERLAREMLRAEAGALPGSPSQPTP